MSHFSQQIFLLALVFCVLGVAVPVISQSQISESDLDVGQYTNDRREDMKRDYLSALGDITNNRKELSVTTDQSGKIGPFNTQHFLFINPPVLQFTGDALTVNETERTATLTVELAESNNTAVSVKVAFLSDSSSADGSDIDNYSTQTVRFSRYDSRGATRKVTVNITNDSDFEGDEKALFRLLSNTAGSVINSGLLTLTITDDDAPVIVFNEINADPGDDANGDGKVDADTDEFIEFLNREHTSVNISGWVYADNKSDRFTFPDGTVIAGQNAVVLFDNSGDVQPRGYFGAAYVFTDDELGLNNSPETLSLKDADGNVVSTATYNNNALGESNNLSPDGTGTSYANHSTLTGSRGAKSSPGTRVDGTAWGNTPYAVRLRGTEGWRFVASPAQNTSFNDLFGDLWTQGISGSDEQAADANIYSWDESDGGLFRKIGDMSDNLAAGKGYLFYAYKDDNFRMPGVQGGFPKVIDTDNDEHAVSVDIPVHATDGNSDGSITIASDEGYNLLGNPFGTRISVDAVIKALEDVDPHVNKNVYIWDNGVNARYGRYKILPEGEGKTIAPFQGFFIRYTAPLAAGQTVIFNRNDLAVNEESKIYEKAVEPKTDLKIKLSDGQKFDSYRLTFSKNGKIGEDLYDGFKLFPLHVDAIQLFSTVGHGIKLAQNELPFVQSLESDLHIPLAYEVPGSGKYTISWNNLNNMPKNVGLFLIDKKTGRKIDMRTTGEYRFNVTSSPNSEYKKKKEAHSQIPKIQSASNNNNSQFELLVVTSASNSNQPQKKARKESVVLGPNYPNPFSTQTSLDLELQKKMHVKVTVWNIVGQKIATMADKMMSANGSHQMVWNVPGNLPSGIYICKVEAGGKVLTRKMTLVK